MEPPEQLGSFPTVVERVVGPYLTRHGFELAERSPTAVMFKGGSARVELSYWLEDLPRPSISVAVGAAGDDGSRRMVGLWRAIPEGEPARAYPDWRFHDETTLENVLHRMVRDVLDVYGWRLWTEPGHLAGLLAEQEAEVDAHYLDDLRRADLAKARRAFDEGRFQEAVDSFVLVGAEALSASDRRRLYEARKQVENHQTGA
ncbi:MAG: hypothetical protein ACRD0U_16305 [Acidimicrobiales bacterium]